VREKDFGAFRCGRRLLERDLDHLEDPESASPQTDGPIKSSRTPNRWPQTIISNKQ
jgi:hypothetical protein